MRRIGILGGTFDPIHHGHLILASAAQEALALERILFMPAQTPPHKRDRAISPADDRVAMIRAAIAGDDRFALSDLDLQSDEPSYTAHLLERYHAAFPEDAVWFIIGADSLASFGTWHDPASILELCRLAVAGRPGTTLTPADLAAVPGLSARVDEVRAPLIDISSTDLRVRAAAGLTCRYFVPQAVDTLIRERRLYRENWPENGPETA